MPRVSQLARPDSGKRGAEIDSVMSGYPSGRIEQFVRAEGFALPTRLRYTRLRFDPKAIAPTTGTDTIVRILGA